MASSSVVLYTQLRHMLGQDIRLYNFANLLFQVINPKRDLTQSRFEQIYDRYADYFFPILLRELAPKWKSAMKLTCTFALICSFKHS